MHVDIDVITQLALGCVALYLLWDRNNMTDRISYMEHQHNRLCDAVADLAEQIEEDMLDIHKQMESKDA